MQRGFVVSAGCLGVAFLLLISSRYPWYWIWIVPILAFLPWPAMLPFFYLACSALLQYGKWFDDWHWLGFGVNPRLALGVLQFAPAALIFVLIFLFNHKRGGVLPATAEDWVG